MVNSKHIHYLDYLRILACLAVVFLHVSVQKWASVNTTDTTWMIYNSYSSFVRWAVPVFVMISGALFLQKERSISTLLRKNIFRLAFVFLIWSVFYAGVYAIKDIMMASETFRFGEMIKNILQGHYHMWFIPMFIALYLCTPILSRLVKDPKMVKYLLLLSLIFSFLIPFVINLLNDFTSGFPALIGDAISYQASVMEIYNLSAYGGYFILGYALSLHKPTKKQRLIIYLLGIAGVILTIILSTAYAHKYQTASARYFQEYTPNVAIQAVAVYVWVQARLEKSDSSRIQHLSKYALGVILIHPFIISILDILKFNTAMMHPVLSVPVVWLTVSGISFVITVLLCKIPLIRKYVFNITENKS